MYTAIVQPLAIECPKLRLDPDGKLTIEKGYAWDGPSGPAIDTKNFMRGALVHDALYQLIATGHLSRKRWRKVADLELHRICREDGMWRLRAWWVWFGVHYFAGFAAKPSSRRPVESAP